MTWATFRALRQPSALSVAGLADLEAQLHLGLRLRALDLGAARLGRHPGCGIPHVAGHAHQPGGDLHPRSRPRSGPRWRPRACPSWPTSWPPRRCGEAIASGYRDQVHRLADGGQVPLLLAISDNGAQARLDRIAYRRNTTPERRSSDREPSVAGYQSRVLTH
jgi:hypothetical protein